MKLSVFPNANPHPKGKEEKNRESKKVSAPYKPNTIEFNNENDLIEAVCSNAWSPFVFSNYRKAEDFVSCDLLVYDIDAGLRIEEAEKIIDQNKIACLCLPSPSHSESNHRFRIIIPLSSTITSAEVYRQTWLEGAKLFGVVDEQCKDIARFYFGSSMTDGFWIEGELYEPKKPVTPVNKMYEPSKTLMIPVDGDIKDIVKSIYGEDRKKIPEIVEFFIKNAHTGLKGRWINTLNSFCFSLALSRVPEDKIYEACVSLAPDELDDKDLYQIKRAIKDGYAEIL